MRRQYIGFLFVVLLLIPVELLSIITIQSNGFTELDVTGQIGTKSAKSDEFIDWVHLNSGNTVHQCQIWGTPWDGANATVETLVLGTITVPIKIDPISSSKLVEIMSDSGWVPIVFGSGHYRLKVSGGNDGEFINWTCRKPG